jgi:hypothetical protein
MVPTISTLKLSRARTDDASSRARDLAVSDAACLGCREPLELHQPDRNLPNRLLATCSRCLAWALIDINDRGEMIITRLPDPPR